MTDQEIDKFIEEVEKEKERLGKCGWVVQGDALIVRAVNIIKALRESVNCNKCKHWRCPDRKDDWGECRHERINKDGDNPEDRSQGQLLAGGGFEGYGDRLEMHKDFGCVCFEALS